MNYFSLYVCKCVHKYVNYSDATLIPLFLFFSIYLLGLIPYCGSSCVTHPFLLFSHQLSCYFSSIPQEHLQSINIAHLPDLLKWIFFLISLPCFSMLISKGISYSSSSTSSLRSSHNAILLFGSWLLILHRSSKMPLYYLFDFSIIWYFFPIWFCHPSIAKFAK